MGLVKITYATDGIIFDHVFRVTSLPKHKYKIRYISLIFYRVREERREDRGTLRSLTFSSWKELESQPEESLSNRKKNALKAFRRKSNQSQISHGFFGVPCDKEPKISGPCHSCYRKQQHLRGVNWFISDVYGTQNMDTSTSNILNFCQSPCIKSSSQKYTFTFPFSVSTINNA